MQQINALPSFAFSFCSQNGFDVAYNWKVFSTEIVSSIWKKKNNSEPPFRPHFIIDGYNTFPRQQLALLIGNPVAKFISACREDGIEFEEAIEILSQGRFPSFHFLPQSRFLVFKHIPIFLWAAPNHVEDFWGALDLVEPPDIYNKEVDFTQSDKLREIYKDDFDLFESIKQPKMLATSTQNTNPSLLSQMKSVGFAVKKFAASGFNPTPPEILASREATCRACPEWDAQALNATGRCRKCGCSTWAKLRMAVESCPIGKWTAVQPSSVSSAPSVVNPAPSVSAS
jgi:hypothetical protein